MTRITIHKNTLVVAIGWGEGNGSDWPQAIRSQWVQGQLRCKVWLLIYQLGGLGELHLPESWLPYLQK
jgi:hypothetical protein